MKKLFFLVLIILLTGCSSKAYKMTSTMKDFMDSVYPNASYDIERRKVGYELTIVDGDSLNFQKNEEEIKKKTLCEFYKAYLVSGKYANSFSEFNVVYQNERTNWKSDTLTIIELSMIYEYWNEEDDLFGIK
ncbi:hypothetical protein [Brumimicrobium aurantiacum]|uniref:Uncharacterized protein n=1 Tax=Brumimicrobium aurantiacum TaxID=1737063 RepID=A0A3E1F103_9FLAO|nr:hypothetical protein [Brumimicrobium aurantiacum]RFC55496.1 hypothetical protein DXU93_00750 [Brumimicrobium aurantiacum]